MNNSNENLQEESSSKQFWKFMRLTALFSGGGCLVALGLFVVFLAVLITLGVIDVSSDKKIAKNCPTFKTASEICKSITVSGYGTMSVDEYVAGVVMNEFGNATTETLKAQAIASRSYGLAGASKDENGNCSVGDTSEAFQTFNPNPSQNVIDAVNATSGMILVDSDGNVARSEYSSNSLPAAYDTYGDMITMSERNLQIPRSWWSVHKTCGDSTLNNYNVNNGQIERDAYGRYVYGCGHGRGMGQIAALYLDTVEGYTYDKILNFFYGPDSEYNWFIASTDGKVNGNDCTDDSSDGGFQPLESYTYNHEGLKVLDHKLTDSEVKSLNADLNAALEYAGHGTGDAVASVGQALVYWFEKQGVYLQYRWGGGHDYPTNNGCDLHGTFTFANPNWGSKNPVCGHDENNQSHIYYGMDCSGFVSWATRTACNPNFGAPVSGTWMNYGSHISLSEAKPGDVIADGNHIQLVIKNNGDGSVVVAEEGGSGGNGSGLVFSLISSTSRPVISMKDYYSKNCTDIHPGTGGSTGKSSGSGKILLIAGHSFSPYCAKDPRNYECRPTTLKYEEPVETRKLVKLLKQKLIDQGYKSNDIDIVNELLGEDFNDPSTSKSLYIEEVTNHDELVKKINFSQYQYAIEIHFNASTNNGGGTAKGVLTYCLDSSCGGVSEINSEIRKAVINTLNTNDAGVITSGLTNLNLLNGKVPFTYLETEYYDNDAAMDIYANNRENVAAAIAKVIKKYYP